jgi:dihydroorotate dehydrogenase
MSFKKMTAKIHLLSLLYRLFRHFSIIIYGLYQTTRGRTLDLEDVILFGDRQLKWVDRMLGSWIFDFPVDRRGSVDLFGLHFSSPLVISSFKDDLDILNIWLKMGLGGVTLKTIMLQARLGNQRPRICETKVNGQKGLINAMGLPGVGVKMLIKRLNAGHALLDSTCPLGISIGGESVQEYVDHYDDLRKSLKILKKRPCYFELNISCPNTDEGQDLVKNQDALKTLLVMIRERGEDVISVKLSPDQSDDTLLSYAQMIASFKRVFINIGNTQYRDSSALVKGGGGLSGPPLFERTVQMVNLLFPVGVPLMATGGVSNRADADLLLEKGAVLVGVATGLVFDPYALI